MSSVFELANFSVYLESATGRTCLADGIDIDVRRGETVCVVGESGSGKSVALLSAVRLLEYTAPVTFSGEVLLDGENILLRTPKQMSDIRGNRIAVIFQEAMDALNPTSTIGSQMIEAYRLNVSSAKKAAQGSNAMEKAVALLLEVGIEDPAGTMKSYPHQLSGGMQQRVVIAMALLGDPEVLIADEPTTALDVTIQADILSLLRRIQDERQMACIFVTHDMAVAATIASRIFVLYAGQVVESGPVETILTTPMHAYTKALLECIPKARTRLSGRMPSIAGSVPAPGSWPDGERFSVRNPLASPESFLEQPPTYVSPDGLQKVRTWDRVEEWTPDLVDKLTGIDRSSESQGRPQLKLEPAIQLTNVSKTYKSRTSLAFRNPLKRSAAASLGTGAVIPRRAVNDVSLTVYGNELFGIVGESGSGKSTLAKLIMDLEQADAGSSLDVQGFNLSHKRSRAVELKYRRELQMVFQNPLDTLNPRRTVAQAICEPLVNLLDMTQADALAKAADMIEAVGMARSYLHKQPADLSGGQRQRVAIARALAPNPRIIVADEPTSALDVSVQAQIINLLLDLQAEFSLTLVMITHNLSLITSIADRIGVMYRGELVETLSTEQLETNSFNHPYTQRLLDANPAPALLAS